GCNPTSSKFIHTWLRFGEIMRGSLSVKPQTWVAGDSALKNPARIVPLEIQERARDNMQQQQRSTKGVTANGVTGSSF
ncbi:hypothetical protein VSO53_25770, partial [Klebsiella pneumoniae]|nr:hypothetical protein [Klebsiella pneumoniae]